MRSRLRSSVNIIGSTTVQNATVDEWIRADEGGKSVSVVTFYLYEYTEVKILIFIG